MTGDGLVTDLRAEPTYRVTDAVEPADVLRAVADEIRRVGWGRGPGNVDTLGHICLYGGLDAVLVGRPNDDVLASADPRYDPAFRLLGERIAVRIGRPDISRWNDLEAKDLKDVLSLLRYG